MLETDQRTDRVLMLDFSLEGVNLDSARAMGFHALVPHLRRPETLSVTKAVVSRLHMLAVRRHGMEAGITSVNVRVFLSGFMIAVYPEMVFENMPQQPLAQALHDATLPLLHHFERMCRPVSDAAHDIRNEDGEVTFELCVPEEGTRPFQALLRTFLDAFRAWKIPDEERLLTRIRHALLALYQAQAHLPQNGAGADAAVVQEFRAQIERLEGKLAQIGGRDALEAFRRDYEQGVFLLTPPPQPDATEADARRRARTLDMVHELRFDPDYRLESLPLAPNLDQLYATLEADISAEPPRVVHLLLMLKSIREQIRGIAADFHRSQTEEEENEEALSQELVGPERVTAVSRFACNAMARLLSMQAQQHFETTQPAWEALCAEGEAIPAVMRRLRFLLDQTALTRLNISNSHIQLIAPVILGNGADYVRDRVGALIDSGALEMESTVEAIDNAVFVLMEQGLPGFPRGAGPLTRTDLLQAPQRALRAIVSKLFFDAVFETIPREGTEAVPALLRLDIRRLVTLRSEFSYTVRGIAAVMAGAVVLTSRRIVLVEEARVALWTPMLPPRIDALAPLKLQPMEHDSFWSDFETLVVAEVAPIAPDVCRQLARAMQGAVQYEPTQAVTERRSAIARRLEAFLRHVVPTQANLMDINEAMVRAHFEERFAPFVRPAMGLVLRLVRHFARLIHLFEAAHGQRITDEIFESAEAMEEEEEEENE